MAIVQETHCEISEMKVYLLPGPLRKTDVTKCYLKLNEYVTIAVNRNLSNCENSPKKSLSGLQRDSNPWPLR